MEDTSQEIDRAAAAESSPAPDSAAASLAARSLEKLLHDHKGIDPAVLDLRELGSWTDFFVVTTVTSEAHMDGLERHIKDFCREREIEILRRSRKPEGMEDEWRIIDLGLVVVHLMSRRARSFYDLERLYSMALTKPPAEADGR